MTDLEPLRATFQRSRKPDDGLAYLAHAVDTGVLDDARIKLAAYLGEPAAIARLSGRGPASPDDLREWITGLGAYTKEAAVRAALAVGRNWVRDETPKASAAKALAAARDWALEPSDAKAQACVESAKLAFAGAYGDSDESDQLRELVSDTAVSVDSLALACCYAAQAVCEPTPERAAAIASLTAFTSNTVSEEQLRAWVREDLVRWALDLGDPLAE